MSPVHSIKRQIAVGEGSTLDFKQTISDASKIAKTLVAFANNKGGTLLIGVRDNGSLVGIESEDEKYMLELAATMYCKPAINVEMKEFEIEGKTIVEARVREGEEKPYYAKDADGKWWVYNRVSDKSVLASAVMFEVIRRKGHQARTLLKYSYLESQILKFLELSPNANLIELVSALKVKRQRVIHSLAKLIYFDLISVSSNNKQETYSLNHSVA